MSFLYKKEIVDGVRSRRKILGIPVYKRDDIDGVVTRKYLLGLFKSVTFPAGKRCYLLGIPVKKSGITYNIKGNKQNGKAAQIPMNSELSPNNAAIIETKDNSQVKMEAQLQNLNKVITQLKDSVSHVEATVKANNVSIAPKIDKLDKGMTQLTDLTNRVNKVVNSNNVNIEPQIQSVNKEVAELKNSIKLLQTQLNLCYYETANFKNLIQCQQLHQRTFGEYRNIYKGKEVVLVATGPTAQYYTPIKDAIYVGVNNACLLENVKLDYLFCQDFYMGKEKIDRIVNYRKGECKKFFGRIPDNRIEACHKSPSSQHVTRCPRYLVDEAEASEYYIYDNLQNKIAYDIELEPLSASGVAFSAFQFILHTHPKRIYLVGCDCSSGFFYSSNIVFNNNYMVDFWKKFKAYVDELYPDIEVVSVNPVGLKKVFKDEYDEAYLIKNR